ncbi:MAG: hypothetical protein Q9218_005642 [Villophora microphyllina]
MVYVAVGLLIACVSYFCYLYKQPKWKIIWAPSKSTKEAVVPIININATGIRHHDHLVNDGNATTKALEPTSVAEQPGEEQSGQNKNVSAESQVACHVPQGISKPLGPPNGSTDSNNPSADKPAGTIKAASFFDKKEEALKAAMQPPARPGPRLRPKMKTSMAPPPRLQPNTTSLRTPPTTSSTLRPPPSAASSLRTPAPRPQASLSPLSVPTASTLPSSKRPSKKVILEPGHSPLDWANLTHNPPSSTYLRGDDVPPGLIRVPPSLLRYHNGRKGKNAWGVWQGKVYNLTPYLKYHPGGVDELMKGAGREKDGERLFLEVHSWVNWEGLLGECMVGILVSEEEGNVAQKESGGLDEMD